MQIVIPMSGRGSRFVRAGYTTIKPLIEVDGKPFIEHVVNLFPGDHDFVFICASDHLRDTSLASVLKRLKPKAVIAPVEPSKWGPVWATLSAKAAIADEKPTLLSYCDFSAYWDFRAFQSYVEKTRCDGAIPSYRGFHPHSLGPNYYAYLRTEKDRVLEIREKGCFTQNRMEEFASAGLYYFRSGKLLKHYFERAMAEKLEVNGEYYASVPYNLLVRDGLDVRVFELEHFLQWGTPEDLQEYEAWSRWFRSGKSKKPHLSFGGTLLMPAAGTGERFRKEGYPLPKPLIEADGIPMVQRSLESLPRMKKSLLVTSPPIATHPQFRRWQEGAGVEVLKLDNPTRGQAETCLLAKGRVAPGESLLISSCDAAFGFDEKALQALLARPEVEFVAWTFRNHPHANRNPKQYGWVRTDADGKILGVSVKVPLREKVENDPGVTGTFWFRRAGLLFDEIEKLIRDDDRINGEFYVDRVIGRLAERGVLGYIFPVTHFICFGTPDDIRTYDYWARYFGKILGSELRREAA